MWACSKCGCQQIAASLTFCPACFVPREDSPAAAPDATAGDGVPAAASVGSEVTTLATEPGGEPPQVPVTATPERTSW